MATESAAQPGDTTSPTNASRGRGGRPSRERRKQTDGTGSIDRVREAGQTTRRDGKTVWRSELWRGRVMVDGKRRVVYGPREADVVRKLDELKGALRQGLIVEPHKRTVAALLDEYVLDGTTRGLKPKTLAYYRQARDRYLVPVVGAVRLVRLTPEHVRRAVADLTARGLSPTTVRNTLAVLNAALQFALRQEWIARNPAATVKPPQRRRPALRPPTPAEMGALVGAAEAAGDRLTALWALACYAGCRPGELLALQWRDLDLEAGTVTVRRTLTLVPGQPLAFGTPKSDSGRRRLRIAPVAAEALRAHERRQAEERLALGPDYEDGGLVFCTLTGAPLRPRWAVRLFKRALERAGLPAAIRLYDLRHGNATAMLLAGVASKAAAERLGHSSVGLFNDTYAHMLQEIDADAAAKLEAVISGPRKRSAV